MRARRAVVKSVVAARADRLVARRARARDRRAVSVRRARVVGSRGMRPSGAANLSRADGSSGATNPSRADDPSGATGRPRFSAPVASRQRPVAAAGGHAERDTNERRELCPSPSTDHPPIVRTVAARGTPKIFRIEPRDSRAGYDFTAGAMRPCGRVRARLDEIL
jgi:hypothetical protein